MGDVITVDVRGLSCPQPVLKTKQTIGKLGGGIVEVLVDSRVSRDNITRLAQKAGWNIAVEGYPGGGFKLILKK